MSTTQTDLTEIARRISEEAFDKGNLEVIDQYVAEDFVGHSVSAPEDIHGPQEYKEFVRWTRSAFPDVESTTEDVFAAGNKVAERHVARGTHQGEFMGIEPTGKEVEVEGMSILHFEDGKLVEAWDLADIMGLMQQLGVMEPPGQSP